MGHIITIAQQKGGTGKTTVAANLGVEMGRRGLRVALVDSDPQGSLGRWFMSRRERLGPEGAGLTFRTASAWGVAYETEGLAREHDLVLVDTPPKIDADLKPALRAASLVLVPVAVSHVDLWATEAVVDLAERVERPVLVVLNRAAARARLTADVEASLAGLGVSRAATSLGQRVAWAETMGQGLGVAEGRSPAARAEIAALAEEIASRLGL